MNPKQDTPKRQRRDVDARVSAIGRRMARRFFELDAQLRSCEAPR